MLSWLKVILLGSLLAFAVACAGPPSGEDAEDIGPNPNNGGPLLSGLLPISGTTDISVSPSLQITFSEPVYFGPGLISLRLVSDGSIIESIPAVSAQVSGNGTETITITPASLLSISTQYYVEIQSNAFFNASGGFYSGFNTPSDWNFTTTEDAFPPSPITTLSLDSPAANSSESPSFSWSGASDADSGIAYYEVAIGYDNEADGFDSGDVENIISFSQIPGGQSASNYQIQDGVDGFSFSALFDTNHYISIRAVDLAGNESSVFSSAAWKSFDPASLNNLAFWLDSSDPSTLFLDTSCTTNSVLSGEVACWFNKATGANHFTQSSPAARPLRVADGVDFDGSDDVLTQAALNYGAGDDMTFFVVVETDTQSDNSASCCRPFVSWLTSASGLYPWLGLTRNTFTPGNNLIHGFDTGGGNVGLGYIPTAPGDVYISGATHNGSLSQWSARTGGLDRVVNHTIPATYTSTAMSIGGEVNNAARRFHGIIKEVVFYDGIKSSTDIENIEGYLACKWSQRDQLDSSHPYYDPLGANLVGCP